MFRRIFFEDWISIFTLIAFITTASIYLSFAWRALRMKPAQRDRLARLPLVDEPPVSRPRHDA